MNKIKAEKEEIDLHTGVKEKSVSYPKSTTFYKYQAISPHLFNRLQSGKFYACHQKDLNDIHDCKFCFSQTYLEPLSDFIYYRKMLK